jgi:methylated-DNA--[protein]-cysteine S-methyltransferase
MNYKYTYESPLGTMVMLGTLSYLTDLFFIDEAHAPSYDDAEYIEQLTGPFEVTIMWLNQYFNGKKPFITPPIQLECTEFRKSVWSILQTIPYGETTTYGDIGKQIAQQQGKEKFSAQAVGGAVGHNPISIIVPCHRVIGSNGQLTGYAGGIERKKYMLDLELEHK